MDTMHVEMIRLHHRCQELDRRARLARDMECRTWSLCRAMQAVRLRKQALRQFRCVNYDYWALALARARKLNGDVEGVVRRARTTGVELTKERTS